MNLRRTDSTAGAATAIDLAPLPNADTAAQTICSASASVPGCRFMLRSTTPAAEPNTGGLGRPDGLRYLAWSSSLIPPREAMIPLAS